MPLGVVTPRTIEEAERAIAICRAGGRAGDARAAAARRSAGQTVNHSLIVDCSKHLNRILDLDVAGRRCAVEPGIVLDDLNRAAQAARPVVSGRCLDRLARHHRRHDGEQLLRRALAALRQHARERALDRRAAGRRRARRISVRWRRICPTCRRTRRCGRWRATCSRSARARPTRSRRAFPRCSAGSAATTSTRWCRARNDVNLAHILVGSEGTLGFSTAIELKLSPVLGKRAVGACHFGSLPRGDGGGAAHRQARRRSRSSWSTRR